MRRNLKDLAIAAGLFVAGVLSRLPFAGHVLYHWDSVNFAFGLEHFDVAAGRPHVPGYILYVFLGRLVDLAFGDAQHTLVAISIASSGLATAFLYLLGRDMFGRAVGTVAALLLLSSPLFWFYGEIALPHSLDCLTVIVAAWLLFRLRRGEERLALPAALWLGIAGGLRPQTQVFFAPLAIYAAWRVGRRRQLLALSTLVLVDLAWFLPLVSLTGGVRSYFEVMGAFSDRFNSTTSIFRGAGLWGLTRNSRKLVMYTLYAGGAGFLPLLFLVPRALRKISAWGTDDRLIFGLFWVLPSLAFYLLVHMGQQGLVFVFLPALLLLSGVAVADLLPAARSRQLATGILVVINAAVFLLAPTYPLGGDRPKLLTVDTLRRHDAYYLPRFDAVRRRFPLEHSMLLSSSWRFPQYYLPHYRLLTYGIVARWELGEGSPTVKKERQFDPLAAGIRPDRDGLMYVVLFDDSLNAFDRSADRQQSIDLAGGQRLGYLSLKAGECLRLGPDSFGVVRCD